MAVRRKSSASNMNRRGKKLNVKRLFSYGILAIVLATVFNLFEGLIKNSNEGLATTISGIVLLLLTVTTLLGFLTGIEIRNKVDPIKLVVTGFVLVFTLTTLSVGISNVLLLELTEVISGNALTYLTIPYVLVSDFLRLSVFYVAAMVIVPAFNTMKRLAQ